MIPLTFPSFRYLSTDVEKGAVGPGALRFRFAPLSTPTARVTPIHFTLSSVLSFSPSAGGRPADRSLHRRRASRDAIRCNQCPRWDTSAAGDAHRIAEAAPRSGVSGTGDPTDPGSDAA